jgi:hypothetical protein
MNTVHSVRRKIPVNAVERKVTYDTALSNTRIQEKEERCHKPVIHTVTNFREMMRTDCRKTCCFCYMLVQEATNMN